MNSSRGASTRVGRETKSATKLPYVNPNIKNTANAQTKPRETETWGCSRSLTSPIPVRNGNAQEQLGGHNVTVRLSHVPGLG